MSDEFLTDVKLDSSNLIKDISAMGEQVKQLKKEMLEAQELADIAKKKYEHYANVLLPQMMFSIGIDSISLSSGGSVSVTRNYYCKPNKNAEDRKKIVEWLRSIGGSCLIEHNGTVAAENFDTLKESGIPFIENNDINTNRLKSFIKDKLGITTGVAQISLDDIPECVHFQEVLTTEINI